MLSYNQVATKPRLLRSFTGLNSQAFEQLLGSFERAYAKWLDEQDEQRANPRQRARGGGRQAVLITAEDKLLFILFYYKILPLTRGAGLFLRDGQNAGT